MALMLIPWYIWANSVLQYHWCHRFWAGAVEFFVATDTCLIMAALQLCCQHATPHVHNYHERMSDCVLLPT